MGAVQMVKICARLQELAISGDLSRAPDLLDALEKEFAASTPRPQSSIS